MLCTGRKSFPKTSHYTLLHVIPGSPHSWRRTSSGFTRWRNSSKRVRSFVLSTSGPTWCEQTPLAHCECARAGERSETSPARESAPHLSTGPQRIQADDRERERERRVCTQRVSEEQSTEQPLPGFFFAILSHLRVGCGMRSITGTVRMSLFQRGSTSAGLTDCKPLWGEYWRGRIKVFVLQTVFLRAIKCGGGFIQLSETWMDVWKDPMYLDCCWSDPQRVLSAHVSALSVSAAEGAE